MGRIARGGAWPRSRGHHGGSAPDGVRIHWGHDRRPRSLLRPRSRSCRHALPRSSSGSCRARSEREDLLARVALGLSRASTSRDGAAGHGKTESRPPSSGASSTKRSKRASSRQFTESTVRPISSARSTSRRSCRPGARALHRRGHAGAVHLGSRPKVLDGRDISSHDPERAAGAEAQTGTKTTASQIECALILTTNRYLAGPRGLSRDAARVRRPHRVRLVRADKGFTTDPQPQRTRRFAPRSAAPAAHRLLTIRDLDVLRAVTDSVVVGDGSVRRCTLLEHLDADLASAAKHDPTLFFFHARYLSTRTARIPSPRHIIGAICVYDAIILNRRTRAEHRDLALLRLSVLSAGGFILGCAAARGRRPSSRAP